MSLTGSRRPSGKKLPLSLRIFSLVLFVHWIDAFAQKIRIDAAMRGEVRQFVSL
jgi:hypothetical protein